MKSHSVLAWVAAGKPEHKYNDAIEHFDERPCATCGTTCRSGVSIASIETATLSGHAELFRFSGGHICNACAWLFSAGKGRPGNFIVYGDRIEYTVISLESVVQDKRPWASVLADVAEMPDDTPVAGVMTTDVKPRLWHRTRLATVGRFGLYVHAPDYDVSQWIDFNLRSCLTLMSFMRAPLAAGFSKTSIYHGLLRDYARAIRDPSAVMAWDSALTAHRGQPHFLPALIAAGVTKENKRDVKSSAKPTDKPQPSAASRDQAHQDQPGLF